MKVRFLLTAITLIGTALIAEENNIPEPYRSIVDLPFDEHGWFGNAKPLERFLYSKPAKTVIEVGSWLGSSARFMAKILPEDGLLYAVDTWAGTSDSKNHMTDKRLPYLYQLFLSNVKHENLTHKIVPVRMKSLEASIALAVKADLIYIDAAHDTQSVKDDIMAWYPHLNKDGIMCGDDWGWPSVRKAVEDRAKALNKKIYSEGNFWAFIN